MKIRKAELLITAGRKDQYPETIVPEIAFAGKSNVGKSSMINALLNRKKLARTSGQPGKTQTINFYNINGDLNFVDLPGYGYARVSKTEREKWGKMIDTYLHSRNQLEEVILLIDIRHSPGEHDRQMYEWIKSFEFAGYVIATKADKISKGKRNKHIEEIRKALNIEDKRLIIPFSSTEKINVDKIWDLICKIASIKNE